jgi:hypothetical protein
MITALTAQPKPRLRDPTVPPMWLPEVSHRLRSRNTLPRQPPASANGQQGTKWPSSPTRPPSPIPTFSSFSSTVTCRQTSCARLAPRTCSPHTSISSLRYRTGPVCRRACSSADRSSSGRTSPRLAGRTSSAAQSRQPADLAPTAPSVAHLAELAALGTLGHLRSWPLDCLPLDSLWLFEGWRKTCYFGLGSRSMESVLIFWTRLLYLFSPACFLCFSPIFHPPFPPFQVAWLLRWLKRTLSYYYTFIIIPSRRHSNPKPHSGESQEKFWRSDLSCRSLSSTFRNLTNEYGI